MLTNPKKFDQLVIDIIRHGEPEGGVRYRGSIDDPLSETGWKQMRQSTQAALKSGYQWDHIISSPMKRCNAFATELSEQLTRPLTTIENLRELAFGDLEGLTPKQAWEQHPTVLENMWKNPEAHTPPNAESFTDFLHRVNESLIHIIKHHSNQHLLVVAHGGVIRASITNLLGIAPKDTFQMEVPYAGMTRFTVYKEPDGTFRCSLNYLNRFHGDA